MSLLWRVSHCVTTRGTSICHKSHCGLGDCCVPDEPEVVRIPNLLYDNMIPEREIDAVLH